MDLLDLLVLLNLLPIEYDADNDGFWYVCGAFDVSWFLLLLSIKCVVDNDPFCCVFRAYIDDDNLLLFILLLSIKCAVNVDDDSILCIFDV